MDKHATLAHSQLLHFPVLHEQVSMKFLTATEDLVVVHKGWKSPLESVFQPHCSGSGISSSSRHSSQMPSLIRSTINMVV